MNLLKSIQHRPWPLPNAPWIMAQTWHDLLFAHWPIPVEALRFSIPSALEIDTFDGQAWIAVVPFRMSGVRLRATPSIPWLSAFPELNVRTYVTIGGKPGVWFFSLDAANSLAVKIARSWFHLPYFRARMSCEELHGQFDYTSQRNHRGATFAEFTAKYRPVSEPSVAQPGTLEHFLTERYCLYSITPRGTVLRGDIHHAPWSLQLAEAEISKNTMAEAAGFTLSIEKPLLHFSRRQDVVVWSPKSVT
jgi:uncharacterized protein YqjF (DUF2071 family)